MNLQNSHHICVHFKFVNNTYSYMCVHNVLGGTIFLNIIFFKKIDFEYILKILNNRYLSIMKT